MVSNKHKYKSKCSVRKQPALTYILNIGFVIFFKSKFLKAEIAGKQQQKISQKAAKISSTTAYYPMFQQRKAELLPNLKLMLTK